MSEPYKTMWKTLKERTVDAVLEFELGEEKEDEIMQAQYRVHASKMDQMNQLEEENGVSEE